MEGFEREGLEIKREEMGRLKREGVKRLLIFKPNLINRNVHSATCRCSVELYKQWFSLADFFAKRGQFAGFSLHNINPAVRISAAVIAGGI
jgi:hypothetical protein